MAVKKYSFSAISFSTDNKGSHKYYSHNQNKQKSNLQSFKQLFNTVNCFFLWFIGRL